MNSFIQIPLAPSPLQLWMGYLNQLAILLSNNFGPEYKITANFETVESKGDREDYISITSSGREVTIDFMPISDYSTVGHGISFQFNDENGQPHRYMTVKIGTLDFITEIVLDKEFPLEIKRYLQGENNVLGALIEKYQITCSA